MKYILPIFLSLGVLSGCQVISPLFVEYNGVRRDVAQWINQQTFLSMQQKRSMVQLSRAQQKFFKFNNLSDVQKIEITRENQIAFSCANIHLSTKQISQLQHQIFDDKTSEVLQQYQQLAPQIKLDSSQIHCE